MTSKKKHIYGNILAIILVIIILVAIFYGFETHIVVFNSCYFSNSTLAVNSSGPFCLPNQGVSIIVNKSILSYYPNSTLAINKQSILALPFSFLNGKPYLTIWNEPSTVGYDSYSFLTIPDTFKVHMAYNASVDTYFMVMTNQQYVYWVRSGGDFSNDTTLLVEGKNISVWFNDSTGCAGYVAVIESVNKQAVSISPDEQILYDPANQPTGACEI